MPNDLIARPKMTPQELKTLVDDASSLQRSAALGAPQMLLRGRMLGLLTAVGGEAAARSEMALFDRAATELGAQVAHIQPHLSEASSARQIEDTAHMLGRLYDAVICQGMPQSLVRQVRAFAGIPVLDRVPFFELPSSAEADGLRTGWPAADARRFLIQALLVRAVN